MQNKPVSLLPTSWLADRLGLSVTTIERLRSKKSPDLPPYLMIGKSIRYDEVGGRALAGFKNAIYFGAGG